MEEKIIETTDKIAEYLGISRRTLCRRIPEMKQAGAIFYKIRRARNGGRERVAYSFPSLLQRYLILTNAPENN